MAQTFKSVTSKQCWLGRLDSGLMAKGAKWPKQPGWPRPSGLDLEWLGEPGWPGPNGPDL